MERRTIPDRTDPTAGPEARRDIEMRVALSELASTFAHRLKNPLAGMSMAVTRIAKRAGGENAAGGINALAKQLQALMVDLSDTVDEIADAVPLLRMERESVDAAALLGAVLDEASLETRDGEEAGELETDGREAGLAGDPLFLSVAFHLLLRASRGRDPFTPRPRVRIAVLEDGTIDIRFSGDGISTLAAGPEALFKPFKRGETDLHGVRLGVARRIIEDHGGSLALRTGPGEAASLEVRFPGPAEA